MNYLLAVSGGVDSVVLLDILANSQHRLIVAHVDHGIRLDSAADARFVEALARRYKLPYVSCQLTLGPGASEDLARAARYNFLQAEAKKHKATIVTAHHQDDLIGSIAINLQRGSGWRGLNVMSRSDVLRPLLGWTKRKVYDYALDKKLEWVEDETNSSSQYLRNRMRAKLSQLPLEKQAGLVKLRYQQKQLTRDIDKTIQSILERSSQSRYFYTMIERSLAVEILRLEIARQAERLPTRKAVLRALLAIKTAKPGTIYEMSKAVKLRFKARDFVVEFRPEVVE